MAPAATQTSTAAESRTPPKQNNKTLTKSESTAADSKADSNKTSTTKPDSSANATASKPLAPPPKPGQNDTPDYFAGTSGGGSLSLEPNPFEHSFGGGSGPETPGGTKLPSVASLTSPSSLLPGSSNTPFNWGGGSLRTGPLSPAMLSGPQNDYFSENHGLRGGFPTPNESGLRSGLTPGGSGSMFPAQSPNSQALFSQLASGGATPSTLDFHRTAISAASKQANGAQLDQQAQQQAQQQNQQTSQPQQQQQEAVTSQPQEMPAGATVKTEAKASGPFDPHDNDAANGLFMLAQGRNQSGQQFAGNANTGQAANKAGAKFNNTEAGNGSEDNEPAKPNTRGKGKKGQATNARRKAEEPPAAKPPPNKKAKAAAAPPPSDEGSDDDDDDDEKLDEAGNKIKMTDEEKRKNFLERNRVAALKCRQRKKQWLANLQAKVEMFSSENDALTGQITQLREEVVNLKTLLLAHKDCPVTQQQGLHGAFMSQVVEPFNPQMNPYGMAPGMPQQQQQVMAGQPMQRRFS